MGAHNPILGRLKPGLYKTLLRPTCFCTDKKYDRKSNEDETKRPNFSFAQKKKRRNGLCNIHIPRCIIRCPLYIYPYTRTTVCLSSLNLFCFVFADRQLFPFCLSLLALVLVTSPQRVPCRFCLFLSRVVSRPE